MYFAFGFIILFSLSLYFLINRYKKNWNAERHHYKGRNYIRGSRLFEDGFYLGCEANSNLNINFSIKEEKIIDKLFKNLGISIECQVENKEFNDKFYIVTEDEKICMYLNDANEMQEELSKLLKICGKNSLKFQGFFFKEDRLWIHILKGKQEKIEEVIPLLFNLIDIFNRDTKKIEKLKLDNTFIDKSSFLLAISNSIGIAGLGISIFSSFSIKAYLLDNWGLIKLSFIPSTIILLILVAIVLNVLGRSSRTHLVLMNFLFVSYIGLTFASFELLKKINIDFDKSIPSSFITKIIKKEVSHSTKGSSSYYFFINNWKNLGIRNKIKITRFSYNEFNTGEIIKIYIKKGRVGFEWIKEIEEAKEEDKENFKLIRFQMEPRIIRNKKGERVLIYNIDKEVQKERLERKQKIKLIDSIYQIGMKYFINKDYINAIKYFQEAGRKGHAKAYQMIGVMHIQGKGVEKNLIEANKWFKLSHKASIKIDEQNNNKL